MNITALSFDSPESTSIIRADYDPDTNTVVAEFVDGRRYQYPGFGLALWEEWLLAPSKGSFFHKRIRPLISGVKLED